MKKIGYPIMKIISEQRHKVSIEQIFSDYKRQSNGENYFIKDHETFFTLYEYLYFSSPAGVLSQRTWY